MKKCKHKWIPISMLHYQCDKCKGHKIKGQGRGLGRWYYWHYTEPWYYWHYTEPWHWYYKRKATW